MIYIFLFFLGLIIFVSMRFSWWRKNISYSHPRVLMYHMVKEHLAKNKSKFNRLRVKPKEFEKQLQWLKNNDFKSYTLSELVSLNKIPEKSVVITFDDGYEDNFINAFPLLEKYNFKATIYIVLNIFNRDWSTDKDLNIASKELNNEKMLSDNQINIMINSGLIEISSHTFDHVNLLIISHSDKVHQIKESKSEINNIFNIDSTSFAYPFGFYDKADIRIVDESKYTNATTTVNGVYDTNKYSKFEIPRIMISGRQGLLAFILKMKKGRCR